MEGLSFVLFLAFGIFALLFLGMLIFEAIKENNIKINYKDILVIAITSIIVILIYVVVIYTRKYAYSWDNILYYVRQIDLLNMFNSNFFEGIKGIIKTTYFENYGYFLLSFTSLLFNYTNHTLDSFVISYVVVTIIPIITVYYAIINKLIQKYELKNKNIIILLSLILIIAFPLLHSSAMVGQPDFMGLIFIGLIILFTMDYDFENVNIKRYILIFLSTLCLIITRRWYIYWVISYYICYALLLFIKNLINKDYKKLKSITKNLIIFGISSIIIAGIILLPMIIRIVKANFYNSYSAWNIGGLKEEIKLQFYRIGGIYLSIMLIGLIYGIKNKRFRWMTIQMLSTGILTLFLFTRLQNMGNHQSLLLVPTYIYLLLICIIAINQINCKLLRRILQTIIILSLSTTIFGTFTENKYFYNNKLYSNISLKPTKREDYEMIGQIDKFILENCDKDHKAYINAATSMYCSDTFKTYLFPDITLVYIIPYESSINSVHGFPTDIFKTKYLFVTNIDLEDTGAKRGTIIEKINKAIKEDEETKDTWKFFKEYKMSNDVTFYVYERVKEFDAKEAEYWIKIFEKETEEFPNLFGNRIQSYLQNVKSK